MRAYFFDRCAGQDAVPDDDRVAASTTRSSTMKADTHPQYDSITATCSCGNQINTRSTLCEDIQIDVCSQCHPFFTGKQKIVDSGGRVDRFKKRFGARGAKR
jgi:large subunit ribosomal protein L31